MKNIFFILWIIIISANIQCSAQVPTEGKKESSVQSAADITGKIIRISPASENSDNKQFLGSIYVEGGGKYDRASINVTRQTKIFIGEDGKRRAAKFEDLKIGDSVSAAFEGPVLESYPVQATAGDIEILKNNDDNSGEQTTIPKEVRRVLEQNYVDWKIAEVSDAVAEFYRRQSKPLPPQIFSGDFNGDGKTDYAVNLIRLKSGARTQIVLLLLNVQDDNPEKTILEEFPFSGDNSKTGVFINLRKQGDTAFDYDRNKKFTFMLDAVEIVYFEKSSVAYIFERGRFREIITSD